MVRDAPYSGLYLMFYTQLKQIATTTLIQIHPALDVKDNGYLASLTHFSCGITAGLLASVVSNFKHLDLWRILVHLSPFWPSLDHNGPFGSIGSFWVYFASTFGPLLSTFGPLSVHFRSTFGPLSVHFWSTFGPLSVLFWFTFGPLCGPITVHLQSNVDGLLGSILSLLKGPF